MSCYDHIALDFDGVVADSAQVCAEEINSLRRKKFPKIPSVNSQHDFALIYPGPLRTSLRRFGLNDTQVANFFDLHSCRMRERAQELNMFEGVASFLAEVDPTTYTIVTSSYSMTVRDVLAKHLPPSLIGKIQIMGRELRMKKSAKFQTILDNKQITANQLLKVGDMVSDILYANDAGVDCAVVGWGYHPIEYLRAFDAKEYLESPAELAELLTNLTSNGDKNVN